MYPGKKSTYDRIENRKSNRSGYESRIGEMREIKRTPDEGADERVDEKPFTTDAAEFAGACILQGVERVEQGAGDQVCGPD